MKELSQDAQLIISELKAISHAKATDCLCYRDNKLELNVEGLSPEQAAAIAYMEKTSVGWKIKFYDKLKALEMLGSYMGLFNGATSASEGEQNNLLEAVQAATGEEMDYSDIPEIQQASDPGNDLVEQTRS